MSEDEEVRRALYDLQEHLVRAQIGGERSTGGVEQLGREFTVVEELIRENHKTHDSKRKADRRRGLAVSAQMIIVVLITANLGLAVWAVVSEAPFYLALGSQATLTALVALMIFTWRWVLRQEKAADGAPTQNKGEGGGRRRLRGGPTPHFPRGGGTARANGGDRRRAP